MFKGGVSSVEEHLGEPNRQLFAATVRVHFNVLRVWKGPHSAETVVETFRGEHVWLHFPAWGSPTWCMHDEQPAR